MHRLSDSDEHGTHTAGTIVGRAGLKGAFGVAPEAQLASAMVIEGGQVIDRILAGMDWLIGEGVHIMSMSLGLRGFTPAFQAVIDALRAANVLPVIAVGNEGPNTSRSPGNYANVLSVGRDGLRRSCCRFLRQPAIQSPDQSAVSCPGGARRGSVCRAFRAISSRPWTAVRWRPRTSLVCRPAVAGETNRDGQRPRACHRWLVHPARRACPRPAAVTVYPTLSAPSRS